MSHSHEISPVPCRSRSPCRLVRVPRVCLRHLHLLPTFFPAILRNHRFRTSPAQRSNHLDLVRSSSTRRVQERRPLFSLASTISQDKIFTMRFRSTSTALLLLAATACLAGEVLSSRSVVTAADALHLRAGGGLVAAKEAMRRRRQHLQDGGAARPGEQFWAPPSAADDDDD